MGQRQAAPCLRCGEIIDINEAAFVADIRLRTVGLDDALRSPSASVSICFTCGDLMAKGDEPPQRTRPLDHIVYELVQEMVTTDLSISLVSWIELRKSRGLPAPTLAELRGTKAFAELRKAMALPPTLEREPEILPPGKRLAS
jgi:hypothetical protein